MCLAFEQQVEGVFEGLSVHKPLTFRHYSGTFPYFLIVETRKS